MAATWKIAACDRTVSLGGKADVITHIHWNVKDEETVSDVVHSGSLYGSVGIDTDDLSSFIAYASVTEANAIAWAKEALGSDEVTRLETDVADQITLSKTPVTGTGVPW
tara:strand:- start:84 stop:410 length:327 start_codon:yes stop_codon:yes gene_type:complete